MGSNSSPSESDDVEDAVNAIDTDFIATKGISNFSEVLIFSQSEISESLNNGFFKASKKLI